MNEPSSARKSFLFAAAASAVVAFAPFLRIFLSGQSFYFRDLSGQFFPDRRFLLEGLARGEWRFWNPLIHEGLPSGLLPHANLPELLQLLMPNEFGMSLFLALHVPFAAIAFVYLARDLGINAAGAACGALIYALGGFTLSTINLYVYVQTIAWAPVFILAFRRGVGEGSGRRLGLAALAFAFMVDTMGLEIGFQACLLAVLLAPPSTSARFARSAVIALLGLALTAASILPVLGLAGTGERGVGFDSSVVLANSIHPLAFAQVLIANFFGDISNLAGQWWGVNFFPRGFPYILSLYLGPTVIGLALAGALVKHPFRGRLVGIALIALAVGLGRYAGWATVLDLSPSLRFLRYPVKAFFTFQFVAALLAAFAVSESVGENRAHLKRVAVIALIIGLPLLALIFLPTWAPGVMSWFLQGFLPAGITPVTLAVIGGAITSDAATGGLVALALAAVAYLAYQERIAASRAAIVMVALVGADLIRGGAGLNSSVTQSFYSLSPEMAHEVEQIKQSNGRVFSCDPEASKSYWSGRRTKGVFHEAFTMATLQEVLLPDFNVAFGVKTALGIDRTGFVPPSRVLSPELAACRDIDQIVPSLQAAGVTHVVSLEPLANPHLHLQNEVSPKRITPLTIRIYQLDGGRSRFSRDAVVVRDIPNELALDVTSDQAGTLIVRDPFAAGWTASVNGSPRSIIKTADGYREIRLSAGKNQIAMTYAPEGLRKGIFISLIALALTALLIVAGRSARLGKEFVDVSWANRQRTRKIEP
ncbi:MAG: YfhO family protein [Vicinamibacteria bacterium]